MISLHSSPSISIIVRTFDRNQFLSEALQSLVEQTRQDFEVIVVDMNASPATDVIESFPTIREKIVHLKIGKILNGPAATNLGVRRATADKIAILDDDNRYDSNHLETLIDGLEQTGADLVYTGTRRTTYTPSGELIDEAVWHHPYDFARLLVGNYIHTVSTAFWKKTWERFREFDERFPIYDDYEFLLRVGSAGRIACLPGVTAESRSFTGIVGLQNHAVFRLSMVPWCHAGVCWVHRNLFFPRGRRWAAYKSLLSARQITNSEMLKNLAAWWYYNYIGRHSGASSRRTNTNSF